MSPVYSRAYPAYYWAPANVEPQPIWENPYCYREPRAEEWSYGNYERPYWYYPRPGKDGYYSYWPRHGDWDPRFCERNDKEFGGDFARGFGRDLRPVYVYPPPPPPPSGPIAFGPFHPGDQFRHPDEYPMRLVPVAYEPASEPWTKGHVKPRCCGSTNHVGEHETRTIEGNERKELMDGIPEDDVKTKTHNMKEFPGPVMCFNPLEWHGKAPNNRIRNEEKAEHPVYWVPMNWNRNEGGKEQGRWVSGNWIPMDMNSRPLRWEESKSKPPAYWIPYDPSRGSQALEEYGKKSELEGNENKFSGYWIPLDSIARLQGDQKDKENSSFEGKFRPFPVLWIPEENLKRGDSQERIPNGVFEKRPALVQKISDEDEKQRIEEERKDKKVRDVQVQETGQDYLNIANAKQMTKNGGLEKEQKIANEYADRPVLVQDVRRMNQKQRPEEGREETKTRDIPVKQVEEEEKFEAEQKAKGNASKVKTRDIPVKQLEEVNSEELQKANKNAFEIKARSLPVKQLEKEISPQGQVQKSGEKAAENHKASSTRASKLPPVCLRVDPLPGKKKTNGKSSSRSPSPPHKNNDLASNDSLQNIKPDAFKIPVELTKAEEKSSIKTPKHVAETKENGNAASLQASNVGDETKKIEESGCLKASEHAGETREMDEPAGLKAAGPSDETKMAGENESEKSLVQDRELKKVDQDLNAQGKGVRSTKIELSRDQAAIRIQAMYRGWQVRKLQPLTKLREIAKIRHRMEELKQQIMSPEFELELERDDKTKVKMGETLMGLLLQLDTIQGLHPVVRDLRKSLARELVQLQEKLDTLVEEARSSHLQQCKMHERENEASHLLQKTDGSDKGLDATDFCNTLIANGSENQEVENEMTKGGNAEGNEAVKDKFEIENAIRNEGKDNVVALEKAESKDEINNATTNDRKSTEDVAGEQENAKVSDNRQIEVDKIDLQNKETENQSEYLLSEEKSLVASDDVISSVNEAVAPLQNTAMENKDKSGPTLEVSSVEEDKIVEPNDLNKQDLALSPVAGNAICPLSVVAQEQETEASGSSIPMDDNANKKTVTWKQGERLKVIGLEEDDSKSLPENDFVDKEETYKTSELKEPVSTLSPVERFESSTQAQNLEENAALEDKAEMSAASLENISVEKSELNDIKEQDAALTLAVEKEMCPFKSSNLDENIGVSDKGIFLDQEVEAMPIEMKVEVCGLPLDKCESKELEALPEKTAGDSNMEFITETSSDAVSDTHYVSHSEGYGENELKRMEKVLNVAENMSGKGGLTASMAEGSYRLAVENAPKALVREDDFSATGNVKNDLDLRREEHVSKSSGATDDVSPTFVGTLGTDYSVNENDLTHSENIHYAERNNSKSERNQDHQKWEEENEKLKEMVEKLVEAEKLQMSTIAQLNDKIKHLESKLGKGKNTRKVRAGQLRLRKHRVGRNTKNAHIQQC